MKRLFVLVPILLLFISCSGQNQKKQPRNTVVEISTEFGKIKILLYEETKEHKENFIKLVSDGSYNGLLFHRVIKGFMIQGGDPQSKNAPSGTLLGNGDPGYTISAEFNPAYYHKRGALAAARMGDEQNPEQRSSGSQFYIVQGKTFTDEELNNAEQRINQMRLQNLYFRYFIKERDLARQKGTTPDMSIISANASDSVQSQAAKMKPFTFSSEQRNTYKTAGGAPHLDASYTVFGEVIEGMEVVDKIAAQPVDANNRPLKNISMTAKILK